MIFKSPFITTPRGRPRKDPREIIERVRMALVYGYSLQRACKLAGLNRKTVYNAMRSNQWLSDEIKRYQNIPMEELLELRSKIDMI